MQRRSAVGILRSKSTAGVTIECQARFLQHALLNVNTVNRVTNSLGTYSALTGNGFR